LEFHASYIFYCGSSCQLEQRLCRHDVILSGLDARRSADDWQSLSKGLQVVMLYRRMLQQLFVLFGQEDTHGVGMSAYMLL